MELKVKNQDTSIKDTIFKAIISHEESVKHHRNEIIRYRKILHILEPRINNHGGLRENAGRRKKNNHVKELTVKGQKSVLESNIQNKTQKSISFKKSDKLILKDKNEIIKRLPAIRWNKLIIPLLKENRGEYFNSREIVDVLFKFKKEKSKIILRERASSALSYLEYKGLLKSLRIHNVLCYKINERK